MFVHDGPVLDRSLQYSPLLDKLGKRKADWKESNLLWREGKRKRRQEKENILEFDLEPWGHH